MGELGLGFIVAGAVVIAALLKDWWMTRTVLQSWTVAMSSQKDLLDRVMVQADRDYAWLQFRRDMEKTQAEADATARAKFASQPRMVTVPSDARLDVEPRGGTDVVLPSHGGA